MKWIGLTGSIATGKSTVARLVESLGVPVIDADQIAHQLTQFGQPGYQSVISEFGEEILNDQLFINRKKLGEIVFSNPEKKHRLESILHPLIQEEVSKQRLRYQELGHKYAFYDIPLLFEGKTQDQFDAIVVVWCNAQIQLQRLMQRNKLTESEAILRIKSQMNIENKIFHATYCIDNSGDESQLITLVDALVYKLNQSL